MERNINVKTITCIVIATMLLITPQAKALFGHVAAERDRRIEAEHQFNQQQQTNGHLYIAISVLSAGVVVALVIGAAVGSKTRRDHEHEANS